MRGTIRVTQFSTVLYKRVGKNSGLSFSHCNLQDVNTAFSQSQMIILTTGESLWSTYFQYTNVKDDLCDHNVDRLLWLFGAIWFYYATHYVCVCVCPLMTYNTDLTVVADGLGKVAEEVVSVAQIATRPSLSRPII